MNSITIERATTEDFAALQKIGKQTFFETFSTSNSAENMEHYLATGFSEEKVKSELKDENSEIYFAKAAGTIIGYLKLNFGPSQTELQDDHAVELERIYVSKDFHGKKVGQILYEKAIEVAKKKKADYVWLGVWEENERAIQFYKKNGFEVFGQHFFKLGDEEQTDLMMKLKLSER